MTNSEKILYEILSESDIKHLADKRFLLERITDAIELAYNKGLKDGKPKWKCMLCGNDSFVEKTPHNCTDGFIEKGIIWREIN